MTLLNKSHRILVSQYKGLIEAPSTGSLVLPANGSFIVTSTSQFVADVSVATVESADGVRTIYANGSRSARLWLWKGSTVTLPAGSLLQLDTGLGVYKTVLTGE